MKNMLLITFIILISGCATTQVEEKPPAYYNNTLDLNIDSRVRDLKIATRNERNAAAAGQVLNFFVGTGASTFNRDDLIGKEITDATDKEILKNPTYDIYSLLKKQLQSTETKSEEYLSPIELSEQKPLWKISYVNENQNYQLLYGSSLARDMHTTRQNLFGNQKLVARDVVSCEYQSKQFPLEAWKENNYQKVVELKPIIIQTCMAKFLPALSKFTGEEYKKGID